MIRPLSEKIKTHLCQQALVKLLEHQQNPSLSIYLPAAKTEAQQQAVFERVLHEAEARLDAFAFEPRIIRILLDQLLRYSNQPDFWAQSHQGLALYLSSERLQAYRCPLQQYQVRVDDYFYVLPLLNYFLTQQPFYLLWWVDRTPRLFAAGHQLLELSLPQASSPQELPGVLEDHLAPTCFSSQPPLVVVTAERSRFEGLQARLQAAGLPNPCHQLEPECPPEDMYALARSQVDTLLVPEHQQLLNRYLTLQAQGQTVADLMALTRAAYNSRVSTLFLVTGYEASEDASALQNQSTDILNRATIYTCTNGGRICAARPEQLGGAQRAAAILRY
ncbi:MAG: hypothetical protein IGS03_00375 [Candidatus Sericytochromatia bacterium]|nr:hypothetical protein [Candidatus Sericytochromatia bacterium]